jgi:hypothetical protein
MIMAPLPTLKLYKQWQARLQTLTTSGDMTPEEPTSNSKSAHYPSIHIMITSHLAIYLLQASNMVSARAGQLAASGGVVLPEQRVPEL